MSSNFNLPISYLKKKSTIDEHIIDDIQLYDDNNEGTYNLLFDNSINVLSKNTIHLWTKHFTNDVTFLKNTQSLLKKTFTLTDTSFEDISQTWNNIKSQQDSFIDKYHYIDFSWLEFLNNNILFLQVLSTYNLTSPLFTLAMPIFMIIVPFFILKVKGQSITFTDYFNVLSVVLSQHQIGQLFNIGSASWDQRIYIFISISFYILQIYQNIHSCYNFFTNLKNIHNDLFIVRNFISQSSSYMKEFYEKTKKLKSYKPFRNDIKKHLTILHDYNVSLFNIHPYELSLKKFYNLGNVMHCYYQLYKCPEVYNTLAFTIDFMGYYDNLACLRRKLFNKNISFCSFTKKDTSFHNSFSPTISHTKPISNSYILDKQLLITGPNAAGKTTLLKSTLINIILSQQLGLGYYSSAQVNPYDYIHCYINIPDTSQRDSLFQAEARRCKNIIDIINNNSNARHFCIFDELYSGTNPYEAVASATAFLKYLNKYTSVSYIITTHFLHLCKKLEKDLRTKNCHMETIGSHKNIKYTYRLCDGISKIKGGTKVLYDLDYPSEILSCAENIINEE